MTISHDSQGKNRVMYAGGMLQCCEIYAYFKWVVQSSVAGYAGGDYTQS
jgi:hypothetical protein